MSHLLPPRSCRPLGEPGAVRSLQGAATWSPPGSASDACSPSCRCSSAAPRPPPWPGPGHGCRSAFCESGSCSALRSLVPGFRPVEAAGRPAGLLARPVFERLERGYAYQGPTTSFVFTCATVPTSFLFPVPRILMHPDPRFLDAYVARVRAGRLLEVLPDLASELCACHQGTHLAHTPGPGPSLCGPCHPGGAGGRALHRSGRSVRAVSGSRRGSLREEGDQGCGVVRVHDPLWAAVTSSSTVRQSPRSSVGVSTIASILPPCRLDGFPLSWSLVPWQEATASGSAPDRTPRSVRPESHRPMPAYKLQVTAGICR